MKLLTYIKSNGTKITVNDRPANIEYAKSLGWKLKEEPQKPKPKAKVKSVKMQKNPKPKAKGKGAKIPEKSAPKSKGQGVKMPIPDGTGTMLYKRLIGEIVEGEETPEEVLIQSDNFPDEFVSRNLEEGWFKTKEEAMNAPPDKPKGN